MIRSPDRQIIISLIDEHIALGGKRDTACKILGINQSTYFRWKNALKDTGTTEDLRFTAIHPTPANKLNADERDNVLKVLNSSEFADSSPHQVVAILADRGEYLASERTCYRLLKEQDALKHRSRAKVPVKRDPPTHVATEPNQVWSWDITYMNGPIKGSFFFLYMIADIFSRFIVGWEVWEEQTGEHAKTLITRASLAEGITSKTLVLHSDNGTPMKSFTMLAKLEALGIEPSFSRPHVSNDNPYSESLFRTCKYRPLYPSNGFANLQEARDWCAEFVQWYNFEHHHSGINFLTPHQRHHCDWQEITRQRKAVFEAAKASHPERWNGRQTRNWDAPDMVYLNRVNV